jgi:hypothetical protein
VKNVGKDNNEKSKKKNKKKMGEPRLSGADRSEMRQAEKIKSAGRRKRRKKKKTIPTCIKFFFFSLVS